MGEIAVNAMVGRGACSSGEKRDYPEREETKPEEEMSRFEKIKRE